MLTSQYAADDLLTLGVGFDWGYPDSCTEWATRYGLTYPIIDDSELALINLFTVPNIPFHVLIDHNSIVRYAAFGFNQQAISSTIDAMLHDRRILALNPDGKNGMRRFTLSDAYPNPFNGTITLSIKLDVAASVTANIIDISGRTITTLVDAPIASGSHKLVWRPSIEPSGVYFFRLQSGTYSGTQKILYIK